MRFKTLFLAFCLVLVGLGCSADSPQKQAELSTGLNFIPDPGVRVENASNPGARVNEDGTVSLLYQDRSTGQNSHRVATTTADSNWLEFGQGKQVDSPMEFRAIELPDGTYRSYLFNPNQTTSVGLTSWSSQDGVNFTPDSGLRYQLQAEDKGTMGVYDLFVDSKGGVVLLYIGDMYGRNNVRRAHSTDNGWTFTFDQDNVLGGDQFTGGPNSYVDQKVFPLPDGRFRLLAMRAGSLYSFISEDDGQTFVQEPGARLEPSDFSDYQLATLNDPQMVLLPDGRYRIYVTGIEGADHHSSDPNAKQRIFSATSEE